MIIGTGIDVVDIARFTRQLERTPRLRERLFVPAERSLPVQSLAARFAAKEAAAKALKAPPGMIWQHCWIEKTEWGAPVLCTEGTVAAEAAKQGIDRWHLSMSHDGGLAMAYVVAEGFPVDAMPDREIPAPEQPRPEQAEVDQPEAVQPGAAQPEVEGS